jgi:prepilin-type N-terminal cleavage/methylation domain-containing protein
VTRLGFTLIEMLIALAIGSLVLGLAASASVATRRVQTVLDASATATARATAVPQLLAWAIGRTGRGVDGCAATVASDGRLWRGAAVDPGDATSTTVEVLAGVDGAGRPALYHRTLPWARQPWLEDVTGFGVLEGLDADGAWRAWTADGATRWSAIRTEVTWTDGDVRTYEVALPHRPCAVAP